jgi:hypothetical protein
VTEHDGSTKFEFSQATVVTFATTGSRRQGERVYANLNRRRVATEPSNSEVARSMLGDGEGGLR